MSVIEKHISPESTAAKYSTEEFDMFRSLLLKPEQQAQGEAVKPKSSEGQKEEEEEEEDDCVLEISTDSKSIESF